MQTQRFSDRSSQSRFDAEQSLNARCSELVLMRVYFTQQQQIKKKTKGAKFLDRASAPVRFRSIDFLYISPCQSIRLTQTESQWPDGGLIRNLRARALLLMRGLGSALELLRTSRNDHQQRAARVGLATNGAQRRSHGLAHAPSESGARHSRDLRGGPREREVGAARHGTCVDT